MYITCIKPNRIPTVANPQLSFEKFCEFLTQSTQQAFTPVFDRKQNYSTFYVTELTPEYLALMDSLNRQFVDLFKDTILRYANTDISEQYTTFRIPKASGGTRTINAPKEPFKGTLAAINAFFINHQILSHNCAYAYVPHRSIKHAIQRHQATEHEWFMKMDMHDFFGSCNPGFICIQLMQIPFFRCMSTVLLTALIKIATLEIEPGKIGLPQGSPLSPWLTNQIMIPIDAKLNKLCRIHNITYTRYADDMLFSSTSKNAVQYAAPLVAETIKDTPLTINASKTRISSIYGKNWNLGLMLNKDNKITVGYRNKERFRAIIHDFCLNQQTWHYQETTELLGKLQYYVSIEPEYFQNILQKYQQKFGFNPRDKMIEIIKTRA